MKTTHYSQNIRSLIIAMSIAILILIDFILKWYFSGPFQGMVIGCSNTPVSLGCDPMADTEALHRYFPLLWDWIGIQLAYNQGVAFSLPIHGLPLQLITIALVTGILFYYACYEYHKKNIWIDLGFICIVAGALAHAYERIMIGHVVDFIAVKYFAILNFADILISVGGIILIITTFVYERRASTI